MPGRPGKGGLPPERMPVRFAFFMPGRVPGSIAAVARGSRDGKRDATVEIPYHGGFAFVPPHVERQRYMRGWCAYFSLALHDLNGLGFVRTREHFANRLPDGRFVDVRGLMDLDRFLEGLRANDRPLDIARGAVIEELNKGLYRCGLFSEADRQKARRLVRCLYPEPRIIRFRPEARP